MIRRSAALVITLSLATVACSSDPNDTTPTVTSGSGPDVTTASSTTDAPTTTSIPTTTTAPTTSTTQAPTTTVDPIAQIEADVKQARLDREAAYFAAASDPTNLELREIYRATHTPASFVDREAFLEGLVAAGTSLRARSELPTHISFPSSVDVKSPTEAAIQICRVDSDIIRVPATETTPELIVDDRIVATLTLTSFVLVDGRWLVDGGQLIERWEGGTSCDPD